MTTTQPTPYQRSNLRAAVISNAAAKLEEGGFERVSLREIARDLGVSHAAPGRHFPRREVLRDALVLHGLHQLAEHLAVVMAGPFDDFRQKLTAFVKGYVTYAAAHPVLAGMMLARTSSETKEPSGIREANDRAYGAVNAMIAAARSQGVIVDDDPERVDMTILAMIQGLTAMVTSGSIGSRSLDQVIDGVVESTLYGLVRRAG